MFPNILQHASVCLLHTLDNLLARHSAREPVGFRQQRPLTRNLLDLPGERGVLQESSHNLLRGQTLGNSEGVLHHFAFDDGIDHIGNARLFAELIFTVFELSARLEHDDGAHEYVRLVDHTFTLQNVSNVPDAESARNIDDLFLREWARRVEPLLAEEQPDAHRDRNDDQNGEDRIPDDHDRMTRTMGAATR